MLCENSRALRWRRMFFSTVILNGGSTPLMHPEMQFRRIVFSTFCQRASFHTAWTRSGHSRAADLRYRKQADASPPAHPSGQKGAADPLAGVGVPPVVP